jgi:hypothetical protein
MNPSRVSGLPPGVIERRREPEAQTFQGVSPRRRTAGQIGTLFAYFLLLIFAIRMLEEILRVISGPASEGGLSRLSNMANSILNVTKNLDDLVVTFLALTITFLLILPVSWVHMMTKGDESDPALTQTLIVLSVIVAGVMMMLEDNLARAFSLVGVVAAVRYRNTLKDPKDAVYVFLSLGIGMACGFQSYHVALALSLFECAILLFLWVYRAGGPSRTTVANRADDELEAPAEQKKGKTPNATVTVQTAGGPTAHELISALMAEQKGNWRLVRTDERQGLTVLEYLGRVSKKRTPPVGLLERLRRADPAVKQVQFQSLRGLDDDAPDEDGFFERVHT